MNTGYDADDDDDDDDNDDDDDVEILSCIIEYSKPDNNRYKTT